MDTLPEFELPPLPLPNVFEVRPDLHISGFSGPDTRAYGELCARTAVASYAAKTAREQVKVCCQDFANCRKLCIPRADYWQGQASIAARGDGAVRDAAQRLLQDRYEGPAFDALRAALASAPAPAPKISTFKEFCAEAERTGFEFTPDVIERIRVRSEELAASAPVVAEPAEPTEAESVCRQAYQVVGCLLSDLGLFGTEHAVKILDNLSQARLVHDDVLPWESVEAASPMSAAEPPTLQQLSNFVEEPGTHKALLGDYRGSYSMGVGKRGGKLVVLIEVPDGAYLTPPFTVMVGNAKVRIVVESGFKVPSALIAAESNIQPDRGA